MKRYKLKKDTPTLKAGAIFVEEGDNFNDYKELVQVVPYGCPNRPWFAVSEIDNFDEWFEEIPEKHERWRGGRGDSYYFIDDEGAIRHEIDTNDGMDNYRYNIGNYFKTEAEAESYKKYLTARQVLLDDAGGGKWKKDGTNLYVYYDCSVDKWIPYKDIGSVQVVGVIYFQDEKDIQTSLEEHKEQWEVVRKYEMGEM